jgi:hypothetical protein
MNIHTKIGLIGGMFLAMCTAPAFAQMPGMPYMPAPTAITLAQNQKYMIASMYDTDYLPYTAPTAAASTASVAADGTGESIVINVQGSIPTTGITVYISAMSTGSGILQAYTSSSITVPANLTEDGISRNLILSWEEQSYTASTTSIRAKIVAVGGVLNVRKLDVNAGIGNDCLGLLLGTFSYPYDKAGHLTTYQLRDIGGVPDKMYGRTDNGGAVEHNFIYIPIVGEDGKIWLNNNLGADYSNVDLVSFNPGMQSIASDDYHAFGSLFQWGRKPDGHELIEWTDSSGTPKYGTTSTNNDDPSDALFVLSSDWRITSDNDLWGNEASANNPCPSGFRVPTLIESTTYLSAAKITNRTNAAAASLRLSAAGFRGNENGDLYSTSFGILWCSTVSAQTSYSWTAGGTSFHNYPRGLALSVRCIEN